MTARSSGLRRVAITTRRTNSRIGNASFLGSRRGLIKRPILNACEVEVTLRGCAADSLLSVDGERRVDEHEDSLTLARLAYAA